MNAPLGEATVLQPKISVLRTQLQRQMGRIKRPERFLAHIDRVLSEAAELWAPKICWVRYRVEPHPERGILDVFDQNGAHLQRLEVGARTNLLEGAVEAFVGVGTVGPEISQRIRELEESNEVIDAYLMDIVGVLALHATHKQFREAVETYSAACDWGVGPVMQPGSLEGWPVEGQKELLSLLPIEKIGVTLNQYFMMEPQKTNSTLVGVGPNYGNTSAQCLCEDCERHDCPWRKNRDYDDDTCNVDN